MRLKILLIFGVLLGTLWKESAATIFTSTLMTGFMGGYLIGRMNLGTFLGVLSNNGSSTQQQATPTAAPAPIYYTPILPMAYPQQAPVNHYYYATPSPIVVQMPVATVATQVPALQSVDSSQSQVSVYSINPVDVPVSLDNKVRERFIRQLALMDPLNCLPKVFCEVSADPYGTAVALDHGTIAAVQTPSQSKVPSKLQKEIEAFEMHLHRTSTTPKPTKEPVKDDVQDDSGSTEDDDSGSDEDEDSEQADVDDSFEQYRKEHEHKLQMQALDEMIDEVDDPEMYHLIMKDRKKQKEKRKKYKKKYQEPQNDFVYEPEGPDFREEVEYMDNEGQPTHFSQEPSMYINRRTSFDAPPRILPPPLPPRPQPPPLFMPQVVEPTEAPLKNMFDDDPFFDGFTSNSGTKRSGRQGRSAHKTGPSERERRQVESDLLVKYRVAYKVAEKYRSPEMCRRAFPSCPYQTKTIMSVVNRLESGLLPFNLGNGSGSKNNIDQFKNMLSAIERLNKATLQAQSRGEPINVKKLMEMVSSPSIQMDTNTSKNIIQEFQDVVSKIKSVKLEKPKMRKKKSKKKSNYNAVHYYKKAQMEALKPKERIPPSPEDLHEVKTAHDDEIHTRKKWDRVPTFKQTYNDMFRLSIERTTIPAFTTTKRPKQIPTVVTEKPIKRFSDITEDDEMDAKESEEAIFEQMTQLDRSPFV